MKQTLKNLAGKFVEYMRRTIKLKLMVLAVILVACVPLIFENDATVLVMFGLMFGPAFFIDTKSFENEEA